MSLSQPPLRFSVDPKRSTLLANASARAAVRYPDAFDAETPPFKLEVTLYSPGAGVSLAKVGPRSWAIGTFDSNAAVPLDDLSTNRAPAVLYLNGPGPSVEFPKTDLRLLLRLKFTEGARFSTDTPDVSYIAGPTVSAPTPEFT